jgi:hypothetical protein
MARSQVVNSLKRDEDLGIAIYAVATGTVAACVYLRTIFAGGTQEPETAQTPTSREHGTVLAEFVAARRPQIDTVLHRSQGATCSCYRASRACCRAFARRRSRRRASGVTAKVGS